MSKYQGTCSVGKCVLVPSREEVKALVGQAWTCETGNGAMMRTVVAAPEVARNWQNCLKIRS